ncbi:hypothetical protein P3T23_001418 [Paraburkholderia sp. GAS448]
MPQIDHRIGNVFERVVQVAQPLEAQQQVPTRELRPRVHTAVQFNEPTEFTVFIRKNAGNTRGDHIYLNAYGWLGR